MSGTGIDAEGASAAVVFDAFVIVLELDVKQQFADENPGAKVSCYQVSVFANQPSPARAAQALSIIG